MKFNKWTLGLAAVGAVSLVSATAAKAVEANMTQVQTALSGVTLSGYVDTSLEWAVYPGGHNQQNSPAGYIPFRNYNNPSKQDGFNLNVVQLNIEKPLDEAPYASGFKVSLLFGPDAVNYNTSVNAGQGYYGASSTSGSGYYEGYGSSDFAIKQAYVALRTPIGNGIDWKIGVFDTPIGYEVFEAGNNPNFTRSYGYSIEPTEHTGIIGAYKVNDSFAFNLGIANSHYAGINDRNNYNGYDSYWTKTLLGSITVTAPDSWGWLAGANFYSGAVYSYEGENHLNYYAGVTMNTPVTGLTVGLAYDLEWWNYCHGGVTDDYYDQVIGLYASYKATDKLSFHARAEYENYSRDYSRSGTDGYDYSWCEEYYELTTTMQYDLWANVISRLELRWDHACNNNYYQDAVGLFANVIYKF